MADNKDQIMRALKETLFRAVRSVEAGDIPQDPIVYGGVTMADNRCARITVDYYDPETEAR
ncbi:hypothetical protein RIdsm_02558 [Roseovarius indicus]|uniref:Uncharacterized protein n=2 Tax=Roseovarius indicus TaxID=540747 RepID=A0A0T5P932_9RHOB|nr:hypothetical protein [Roseovarius indicus]KRS17548.1 hypothetical protein XM52_13825 [Roseovarius indicus]QEW26756.1 hypothetical protein RIdsm_02558 [Roseovarius indicus]SFD60568.1 hypothetical protein SAMN04488031_101785 [Roseovarius indicus]